MTVQSKLQEYNLHAKRCLITPDSWILKQCVNRLTIAQRRCCSRSPYQSEQTNLVGTKRDHPKADEINTGRLDYSVRICGNFVEEQVEPEHFARQERADWLVLQPPFIGHCSTDVDLVFFENVANCIDLPATIRNALQHSGYSLSGDAVRKLDIICPIVTGVKSKENIIGIQNSVRAVHGEQQILGSKGYFK